MVRDPHLASELIVPLRLGRSTAVPEGRAVTIPDQPEAFFWNPLVLDPAVPLPGEDRLSRLAARELAVWGRTGARVLVRDGPEDAARDARDRADLLARGYREDPILVLEREGPPPEATAAAEIRPLVDDDHLDAAIARRRAANTRWPAAAYARVVGRRLAAWRSVAAAGEATWWGAFADGELVADLGLARSADILRFAMIFVAPEHRRRGLARALITRAARAAAGGGAHRFVIGAAPDHEALALYTGLGFAPRRHLRYFVVWPDDWAARDSGGEAT
ncbi:MAG: GNAT family N-acetyltransferase [Planctomycetota bacterium]